MAIKQDITYKINNSVTATELISVFKSVGWKKNPENIVSAFKNSYYITAYAKGKLIGFARAISDREYYTSIFDVILVPEYQKKGVAKKMVLMIKERFKGTYFFLTYTEGNKEFYEKCGFKVNKRAMWIERQV